MKRRQLQVYVYKAAASAHCASQAQPIGWFIMGIGRGVRQSRMGGFRCAQRGTSAEQRRNAFGVSESGLREKILAFPEM